MAEGVSFRNIPIGSLSQLIEQNHELFYRKAPFTMAYYGASTMSRHYPNWMYTELFHRVMCKDQSNVWAGRWADELPELVWIIRYDWMEKNKPEYE